MTNRPFDSSNARHLRAGLIGFAALLLALLITSPAQAAITTYVVNTTSDTSDGMCNATHCSLREAINAANATPAVSNLDRDIIRFNIPGSGPFVIRPATDLPAVTGDWITIDATTQPGYMGRPIVVLEGNLTVGAVPTRGLLISSDHSIVRGLVINRFLTAGVIVDGSFNSVEGSFIGTDAAGTMAQQNVIGVEVRSGTGNRIGGPSGVTDGSPCTNPCNLISGNRGAGIQVETGAEITLVGGNLIGTDISGTTALQNGGYGIDVSGPTTQIGYSGGNVISGNGSDGVRIWTNEAYLEQNRIGTNASGTAAIPNRVDGIAVSGTNVQIRNNQISGNMAVGITIHEEAAGAVVAGNKIGSNEAGTASIPNRTGGILLSGGASNVRIGGTVEWTGNLIMGNDGHGLQIIGAAGIPPGSPGARIWGNTIQDNFADGISLQEVSDVQIGGLTPVYRNVIIRNRDGIVMIDVNESVIEGNYIGIARDGITAAGNRSSGIFLSPGSDNRIGGTAPGAGNVVSGNQNGIYISEVFGVVTDNVIEGNLIGTDASGTRAVGNSVNGILLEGQNNRIGGTSAGARNVISGNLDGIAISGLDHVVQGNFIGVDISGFAPLGNEHDGIFINGSQITIGGTDAGAGNVIAYNGWAGIWVYNDTDQRNALLGNSIYNNDNMGIVLGLRFLVVPNDVDDPDNGANRLQNFPVLTTAATDGGTTTITGTLNSNSNQPYRIEFFASTTCDPTGHGEGERYLGFIRVNTGGGGNANINATGLSGVLPGHFITATATNLNRDETSQFSACIEATISTSAPIVAGIEALKTQVNGFVQSGDLTAKQGKTLNKKLDAALKQMKKGKLEAAGAQMEAFIRLVNVYVQKGQIEDKPAGVLLDGAMEILELINNPQGG
jgi:CSLREA domain-containing protein